jgi:hypothetical protein
VGFLTTVRRLIARSNAIWTGNDRPTDDATVRTGFVLNLANPLDIVLECCRPEFLALHLLVPVALTTPHLVIITCSPFHPLLPLLVTQPLL